MKRRKEPIVTISENRKHVFTDYGDHVHIAPAPRGSYGYSQIKDLPVNPATIRSRVPSTPPTPPPPPPKPSARDILRQSLGLDTIGQPKSK